MMDSGFSPPSGRAVITTDDGVDVTAFGALGDATTDNYTAFVNAIAYAKEHAINKIKVPFGRYMISSAQKIVIDFNSFEIEGDGRDTSVIYFNHAAGGFLFNNGLSYIYRGIFKNIQLNGNNVCNTLITITNNAEEFNIYNCVLKNAVQTIINCSGYLSLTCICNTDITYAPAFIKTAAFNNLFLDCSIVYKIDTVFDSPVISNLICSKTCFENVKRILSMDYPKPQIDLLALTGCVANLNQAVEPFYIGGTCLANMINIVNSKFILSSPIKYLFNFPAVRTAGKVVINIEHSEITGSLTNIIQVNAATYKHLTVLNLFNTQIPFTDYTTTVNNNNAYVNALTSNTSVYLSTSNNGIKFCDTNASAYEGRVFYDPLTKRLQVSNQADIGRMIALQRANTSINRPTADLQIGDCFFDTTLNKPLWWNGTKWRDAAGTVV